MEQINVITFAVWALARVGVQARITRVADETHVRVMELESGVTKWKSFPSTYPESLCLVVSLENFGDATVFDAPDDGRRRAEKVKHVAEFLRASREFMAGKE